MVFFSILKLSLYKPKISDKFGSLKLGKLNKGLFWRFVFPGAGTGTPWTGTPAPAGIGPPTRTGGAPGGALGGGRGATLFIIGPVAPGVPIGTPWLFTRGTPLGIPPGGT